MRAFGYLIEWLTNLRRLPSFFGYDDRTHIHFIPFTTTIDIVEIDFTHQIDWPYQLLLAVEND